MTLVEIKNVLIMLARENGLLNLIQDFNRKLFFKFDKTKLTPEYRIANINSKATAKRNVEFDFNLFEGAESSADDSTDGGKEYDDDDEEPEEASAYEEEESFNTSEPESSSSRVTSLLYDDEEFESQPAVAHRRDSHSFCTIGSRTYLIEPPRKKKSTGFKCGKASCSFSYRGRHKVKLHYVNCHLKPKKTG